MRAVVSGRRVGLPSWEADRDRQFQTYEVRSFQDEQIEQLVKLWFRELARHSRIDQATANRRVQTLLSGLKNSSQQILEMASNPLLLTLLCVVVLLGNEIPQKRVRFYEQCLDVLLDRWPQQRGEKAPVELSTAREALAYLAFYLHAAKRQGNLGWAEAVSELVDLVGDDEVEQPVVNVSWKDATLYCKWLTTNHPEGYVFQLPSEAQWEYSARDPQSQTFPWGEDEPSPRLARHGFAMWC